MKSRTILSLLIFATAILRAACRPVAPVTATTPGPLLPFSLSDVSLAPGTDFAAGADLNHEYLLMLEVDNLLFNFRTTAGLPAPGASYGGWEAPDMEVRGQFLGHFLSALAFAAKSTGNPEFLDRSHALVQGLAECQAAYGDGYLAAFPPSFFDRLEALQPVWVPYYVVHKMLAGMLDQYRLLGQDVALDVAVKMGDYFCGRVRNVVAVNGTDYWQKVLDTEFGGMNDALYQLALETGNASYAECAAFFDKPSFYNPLVAGADALVNRHANTHLAQVNGFVSRFEATGDEDAAVAVETAFDLVTGHHSFSSGGSSWYEYWHAEDTVAEPLLDGDAGVSTQESCTQYNVLKIARSLLRWSGSAAVADFYERAILNGVIGIQRKPHTHPSNSLHSHSHSHSHGGTHHHHDHSHADMKQQVVRLVGDSSHLHAEPINDTAVSSAHRILAAATPISQGFGSAPGFGRPDNYKVASWPAGDHRPPASSSADIAQERLGDGNDPGPGVYIYFTPLSFNTWKGETGRGWAHGWGDPFQTFWCCYGTAVESFAKLADSIYFYRGGGGKGEARAPKKAKGGSSALPADREVPELFVTQLVSSTLQWRELGVEVRQTADVYGGRDNIATATLAISIPQPDSASQQSKQPGVEFVLQWRVPSWVNITEDGVQHVTLSVNGAPLDVGQLASFSASGPRAHTQDRQRFLDTNDGRMVGNSTVKGPDFGGTAKFVSIPRVWQDGDVVEVAMAMGIRTEGVADGRPEAAGLRAILMGPLLMAGLTTDGRTVVADPDHIADAVFPAPPPESLISLARLSTPTSLLLSVNPSLGASGAPTSKQLAFVNVEEGGFRSRADALAATWRLVDTGRGTALVESVLEPGRFLTVSPSQPAVFTVRPKVVHGRDANGIGARQEFAVEEHDTGTGGTQLVVVLDQQTPDRLLSSGEGSVTTSRHALLVQPAVAELPKGARILRGEDRQYLLVPLGQIVDERYTAYFDFQPRPAASNVHATM